MTLWVSDILSSDHLADPAITSAGCVAADDVSQAFQGLDAKAFTLDSVA